MSFSDVRISPDGAAVAARGRDEVIRLWSVASGGLLHRIGGRPRELASMAFTHDGKALILGTYTMKPDRSSLTSRKASWYDVASGEHIRSLDGDEATLGPFTPSPDGKRMLTVGEPDTDALDFREPLTGKPLSRVPTPRGWSHAAFAPDGRTLYTGSIGGDVSVWDLRGGGRALWRQESTGLGSVTSLAPSPDGKSLAVASGHITHPVILLDAATGKKVWGAAAEANNARCMAFARKGEWLVVGWQSRIHVLDARSGEWVRRWAIKFPRAINSLVVSPDHRWLVTGVNRAEGVGVWDLSK